MFGLLRLRSNLLSLEISFGGGHRERTIALLRAGYSPNTSKSLAVTVWSSGLSSPATASKGDRRSWAYSVFVQGTVCIFGFQSGVWLNFE